MPSGGASISVFTAESTSMLSGSTLVSSSSGPANLASVFTSAARPDSNFTALVPTDDALVSSLAVPSPLLLPPPSPFEASGDSSSFFTTSTLSSALISAWTGLLSSSGAFFSSTDFGAVAPGLLLRAPLIFFRRCSFIFSDSFLTALLLLAQLALISFPRPEDFSDSSVTSTFLPICLRTFLYWSVSMLAGGFSQIAFSRRTRRLR
mmetsp:Transcript_4125/g.15943  ORF Transcript_4125/g.15943 Transcript_4125/m.15943 type:complete len:206 (+) Transcript_4125:629-1246(+)